jgi:transposase-like protein
MRTTTDARQLDHATLEAMRERAVRSVQREESPVVVARVISVSRSTTYGWLARARRAALTNDRPSVLHRARPIAQAEPSMMRTALAEA